MSEWQNKAWGQTRCTIERPEYQEHELKVKAGGYCSVHYHERRANSFEVLEGVIAVCVFRGWTWQRRFLSSGSERFVVPSQVVHRFEVFLGGRVIEAYWPDRGDKEIRTDDIVRLDEGGRILSNQPAKVGNVDFGAKHFDAVLRSRLPKSVQLYAPVKKFFERIMRVNSLG